MAIKALTNGNKYASGPVRHRAAMREQRDEDGSQWQRLRRAVRRVPNN